MTNPDNAGGLPEFPAPFGWYRAWLPNGEAVDEFVPGATKPDDWPDRDCVPMFNPRVVRAYGEQCRSESEEWVKRWRALSDTLTVLVEMNLAQSEREAKLAELCRAAPAGGDEQRLNAAKYDLHTSFAKFKGYDGICDAITAAPDRDSAPAGSGEVEQMAKRLDDAREIEEETSGLEDTIDAMRTAADLLRKLQQGAESNGDGNV